MDGCATGVTSPISTAATLKSGGANPQSAIPANPALAALRSKTDSIAVNADRTVSTQLVQVILRFLFVLDAASEAQLPARRTVAVQASSVFSRSASPTDHA
jgi:hypothetical protein